MTELLSKLAAHIRAAPNPEMHVIAGRAWSEDEPGALADAEPRRYSARLVDPKGTVDGVPVGAPASGRLAFFMDGMERKVVPLYLSAVPVVYGYVAAAIRVRGSDRRMRSQAHLWREALYMPYELADPTGFQAAGMRTSDTAEPGKPPEEHPMILLDAARKRVSNERDRLEAEITSRWLAEFAGGDGWLLVDGSLVGDYDRYDSPNIVGVVKSHQTQYFPMDEQKKILGLRAGERSGVFVPGGRKRPDVYSWYLRLHGSEGRDLYFGLVRIEAAACERTLEMADEISRWLLAERCPLSLPDSRWDKMIYPIRDCEQYLRSLAPTSIMLDASLTALAAAHRTTNDVMTF